MWTHISGLGSGCATGGVVIIESYASSARHPSSWWSNVNVLPDASSQTRGFARGWGRDRHCGLLKNPSWF